MAKKYIDAEKLIATLERQNVDKKIIQPLIRIIDSLQQEQPCDTCTNDKGCVTCKDGELWEGKEQPSEELEKYASRAGFDYVDNIEYEDIGHIWNDHDVEYAYRDGFIAGAEWQKEKILQLAKNRYEMAMTFVSGNMDVNQAIQLDRLALVTIIQKMDSK